MPSSPGGFRRACACANTPGRLAPEHHHATESCDEHEQIAVLLAARHIMRAARLMTVHIGNVEAGITKRIGRGPLLDLWHALQITPQNAASQNFASKNVGLNPRD